MGKFRDMLAAKKDEAWLAWLSDDPPPPEVTQAQQRPRPVTSAERLRKAPVTIQISIHKPTLPKIPPQVISKFTELKSKLTQLTRKQLVIGGSVLAIVVLMAVGGTIISHLQTKNNQGQVAGVSTNNDSTASAATPKFKPMSPINKPELATVKDPKKAVYDDKRQVFSFADTINENPVTVSQQEEPESVRKEADGLQKVAKSLNANQSTDTHWGKAHIATNPKTGGQTVVFIANGLLIFLQTPNTQHDNNAWKSYVNDLTF